MSRSLVSFLICTSAVNSLRIRGGDRIIKTLTHLVAHARLSLKDSARIPFFLLCCRKKSSLLPGESCPSPILPYLLSAKPDFSSLSRENLLSVAALLAMKYRN